MQPYELKGNQELIWGGLTAAVVGAGMAMQSQDPTVLGHPDKLLFVILAGASRPLIALLYNFVFHSNPPAQPPLAGAGAA